MSSLLVRVLVERGIYTDRTARCGSILIGLLYPLWCTLKSLSQQQPDLAHNPNDQAHDPNDQARNSQQQRKWLMYWSVYSAFHLFEMVTSKILQWVPLYQSLKLLFHMWLVSPQSEGATSLYQRFMRPFCASNEGWIDPLVDSAERVTNQIVSETVEQAHTGTQLVQQAWKSHPVQHRLQEVSLLWQEAGGAVEAPERSSIGRSIQSNFFREFTTKLQWCREPNSPKQSSGSMPLTSSTPSVAPVPSDSLNVA